MVKNPNIHYLESKNGYSVQVEFPRGYFPFRGEVLATAHILYNKLTNRWTLSIYGGVVVSPETYSEGFLYSATGLFYDMQTLLVAFLSLVSGEFIELPETACKLLYSDLGYSLPDYLYNRILGNLETM